LLIKSYSLHLKCKGRCPPLGIMYISAYLKKHFSVEVAGIDIELMRDPVAETKKTITSFNPDVVGISALTSEAHMMHQVARWTKVLKPNCPVIVGGHHASSDPKKILQDGNIDVAVIGEGEETFKELVKLIRSEGENWNDHRNLKSIKGIVYRGQDGDIVTNAPRPFIQDLDSMPFPDWDLLDIRRFWKMRSMSSTGVRPYVPVFTSRGCPFKCTFCHQNFGRRFRFRSPENVIEEVREIKKRYGVKNLEILDDIVNFKPKRFDQILEGLLENNLQTKLTFPNGVRTDLMEEDTIKLLSQVGVGEISVAVETASPRLQKMIKKNINLDKVYKNIELLDRYRIHARGFFMLGFPTETREELHATINYACKSALHIALFFTLNPYPHTEIYQQFKELNKLPEGVRDIDYEYYGSPFNGSEVPDSQFRWLVRYAFLRFYSNPFRIIRLLRVRPYYKDLPIRLYDLIRNAPSFRRLAE
jgi:radical SAM superfamily enzyme YgiQ (UPF0313 family)